MKSRVWVVNYSGHKIYKAEIYGETIILTTGKVNIFQSDRVAWELARKLRSIRENDYILISGTPILNAMVMVIALTLVGRINYLLYDAKTADYVVRTISSEDIDTIIKEVKDEYTTEI